MNLAQSFRTGLWGNGRKIMPFMALKDVTQVVLVYLLTFIEETPESIEI